MVETRKEVVSLESGKIIRPSLVAITRTGKKYHGIAGTVYIVGASLGGGVRVFNGDIRTIEEGEHLEYRYAAYTRCGMTVTWKSLEADGDYGAIAVDRSDYRIQGMDRCWICAFGR